MPDRTREETVIRSDDPRCHGPFTAGDEAGRLAAIRSIERPPAGGVVTLIGDVVQKVVGGVPPDRRSR